MGIALEKRLRRTEKALASPKEPPFDREELRELASTPEGRRLAMESAERVVSAMRAQERARMKVMTSPEQLARLRKQWAEEDARRERYGY
jgi:hypothetical protein